MNGQMRLEIVSDKGEIGGWKNHPPRERNMLSIDLNHKVRLEMRGKSRVLGTFPSALCADIFVEAFETRFTKELAALGDINELKLLDRALDYLQNG